MARWTEDLTLDFAPAEILLYVRRRTTMLVLGTHSFLNMLREEFPRLLGFSLPKQWMLEIDKDYQIQPRIVGCSLEKSLDFGPAEWHPP